MSDEPVPRPSDPVIPRAPGPRPVVREGISTAPQIEIGKSVGEPLNVTHTLPLPADTPFGNLSLKYGRIVERLDHVNLTVQKAFASFDAAKARDFFGGLTEHALLAEEIVYWLRKTADELIGLLKCFGAPRIHRLLSKSR